MAGRSDRAANPEIAEMPGEMSLPRRSGELVFHDPWERRVFALAVSLCEGGCYAWDEFREQLISEIDTAEQAEKSQTTGQPQSYYESWLAAFEKILVEKKICAPDVLQELIHRSQD